MSKIDWDAKLEVSTEGGMVYPATLLGRKSLEVFWHAGFKDYVHCFYENGLPHPGLHHTTVRNVTEPKVEIEAWAIKRAEELSGCNF